MRLGDSAAGLVDQVCSFGGTTIFYYQSRQLEGGRLGGPGSCTLGARVGIGGTGTGGTGIGGIGISRIWAY